MSPGVKFDRSWAARELSSLRYFVSIALRPSHLLPLQAFANFLAATHAISGLNSVGRTECPSSHVVSPSSSFTGGLPSWGVVGITTPLNMYPLQLLLVLFALSVATAQGDPFDDPVIRSIQQQHDKGVQGDKAAVVALISMLEKETVAHPENKLMLVYLGSSYTLRSRDLFYGPSKWKYLQLGIKTMDQAVDSAPQDLAVRFVRAVNYYQLPSFFGRREIARADFQSLLASMSVPAVSQTLDTDTMQAIYYYAGKAYNDHSDQTMARTAWNDGIKLAPNSPLGEKIALELNKLKS